jgi:hypothetical protein
MTIITGIVCVLFASIFISSASAAANYSDSITDRTGDLTGTQNDDIDITLVESSKVGDEIVFEITVVGEFNGFMVNINFFADGEKYLISDSNMTGTSSPLLMGPDNEVLTEPTVNVSGSVGRYSVPESDVQASNSFRIGEVTLTDENSSVDFVGSNEISDDDDTTDDDDTNDDDTSNDDDTEDSEDEDSPGFGMAVMVAAVIISGVILYRKRH